MNLKLKKFFVSFLFGMALFVTLFAFLGPKGKSINLKTIDFNTTKSSELYFKNMRSYFYDKEEREDAGFMLYRIGSREKDTSIQKLNFVLVNNWRMSECYLLAESKEDIVELEWKRGKEAGKLRIDEKNTQAHFKFGAEVYEVLDHQSDMWLIAQNKRILFSEEEKNSLKTTLKDYFKLVGKLR